MSAPTEAIEAVFAETGGLAIDPPTLMPAAVPLELSGEAVRARLCVFTDEAGNEQALRPDLTLPVAAAEGERLKARGVGEQAYTYSARAYRLPSMPGQPLEFTQVGMERFGGASMPGTDADLYGYVSDAAEAGGIHTGRAMFGDLAIFPAFVDRLDLDPSTANALKRAFRQAGGVRALLTEDADKASSSIAAKLKGASRKEAAATVRSMLDVSGVELVGVRTLDEVVDGLIAKAASGGGGIPDAKRAVLWDVLGVSCPVQAAAKQLSDIAGGAGLKGLSDPIDALFERMELITKRAPAFLADAQFGTPFGRRFNYYDGFVFELFAPGAAESEPFGAGGRYDTLIGRLTDEAVSASGVGGVIRPDRIGAGT